MLQMQLHDCATVFLIKRTMGKRSTARQKRALAALFPNFVHTAELHSRIGVGDPVPDITESMRDWIMLAWIQASVRMNY